MNYYYEAGSIVWVKLSQHWWPGSVKSADECPLDFIKDLKKDPLAIVKFFNEVGLHHVTKQEQIFSYNCNKKEEFIKKGLNSVKSTDLSTKFEDDVAMAEKLTGGNINLIKDLKEEIVIKKESKKNYYSSLGFGEPKPVKKTMDINYQRKGFSNIGESILYKPNSTDIASPGTKVIEHIVKIMEQPKEEPVEPSSFFKCYTGTCEFTCSRVNVMIWHNKIHLKTVHDFDTGIKVPYRRKRKSKINKNKNKKLKTTKNITQESHSQSNGHALPNKDLHEAKQLLLDWDDDEDNGNNGDIVDNGAIKKNDEIENGNNVENNEAKPMNGVEELPQTNGIEEEEEYDSDEDDDDDDEDDSDGADFPPQPRRERQPMPKQIDINSAFDALLAESSPLNAISNNHNSSYINNDSDSDGSWEKYYEKHSDSEEEQESDIMDICEENKLQTNGVDTHEDLKIEVEKDNDNNILNKESLPKAKESSSDDIHKDESSSSSLSESSAAKRQQSSEKASEEVHSRQSPSPNSSNSSGPAYMLVAVDAHGNNVPMPVLSEGANHLVAVEASMEDGTTRTLYIDPAHLGPNVDLNNLMLHIDNSGQETVIIPTSTADEAGDKESTSSESDKKSSSKFGEDVSVKRKTSKDFESVDGKTMKSLEGKVTKLKKSSKGIKEKQDEHSGADESHEELADLGAEQYEGSNPPVVC